MNIIVQDDIVRMSSYTIVGVISSISATIVVKLVSIDQIIMVTKTFNDNASYAMFTMVSSFSYDFKNVVQNSPLVTKKVLHRGALDGGLQELCDLVFYLVISVSICTIYGISIGDVYNTFMSTARYILSIVVYRVPWVSIVDDDGYVLSDTMVKPNDVAAIYYRVYRITKVKSGGDANDLSISYDILVMGDLINSLCIVNHGLSTIRILKMRFMKVVTRGLFYY